MNLCGLSWLTRLNAIREGAPRRSRSFRGRRVVAATVALASVFALGLHAFADQGPDRQLARLLARAGEQVRRFEQSFAAVLSDEDYEQHATGRFFIGPQHRRTRAEMLFLWLPNEATWLTVRSVLNVDGKAVAGSRHRLNDALDGPGAERLPRLRQLVNESARYNVGRTFRNFNYPTLVLSYLDSSMQTRFAFSLAGRERVRGSDTWKVNFVERSTPTVIQGDGTDRLSRGTVWIADGEAVLVRTRLEVRIPKPESSAWATLEVDYQRNAKLDMWVPAEMRETYMEMRGSTVDENIGGKATYSNFRRFETSARVLPPR